MKITEIIVEGKDGTINDVPKDQKAASRGIERFRDVGGYDRVYHLNRISMAAAMSDGKSSKAADMPQSSWYEKYNTAHPYTDEEHKMMQSAFKTVDSDHQEVVKRSKSEETDEINKVSPSRNPGPVKRKNK